MTMSPDALAAFLARPLIATLVTLRADGSPTAVPVWFEWDGTAARLFTGKDSGKVTRIAADPRVALSIAVPATESEAWVAIDGTATIEATDLDLVRRLAYRYYGPDKAAATLPGWEANSANWVTISITPTKLQSS
jgi:PPOX class probable F420-dependent enzyme